MNTPLDNIIAALKKIPSIKHCDIRCFNESYLFDEYAQLYYYTLRLTNINDVKMTVGITPSTVTILPSNKSRVCAIAEQDNSNLLLADVKMLDLESLGQEIIKHFHEWKLPFKYKYQADLHL